MDNIKAIELAESHWRYSKGLLICLKYEPSELEHYLYVQGIIHGIKHGESFSLSESEIKKFVEDIIANHINKEED